VNTSPEPFSNIALSLLGDAAVPGMLWLAFEHPWLALAAVAVATLSMVAIVLLLFKFVRMFVARLRGRQAHIAPQV
jgi:membrane protein YdbS with pleckstrin-like domain